MKKSALVWANLVMGLVVLLAGLRVYLDYSETMDSAFDRLENLARIADEQVSGSVKAVDILLEDMAHLSQPIASESGAPTLLPIIKARAAGLTELRSLLITDATGRVLVSTNDALTGYDASQRAYYTAPLTAPDRNRLFVIGPLRSVVNGEWLLFFSRPRSDTPKSWTGVAAATLTQAYFARVLDSVMPRSEGIAEIVTAAGAIVARAPARDELLGHNIANPAFTGFVASGARSRHMVKETVSEGIRRLMVYRQTGTPGLVIVLGQSESAVLALWVRNTLITGLIVAILVAAAFFALRRLASHERSLRESRERLRLLFDANSDAIFMRAVTPAGPGCFEEVNASACRHLGYTRDELLRLTPVDIDPEAGGEAAAILARLEAEGVTVMERTHLAKDGRRIPVEIHAHLFTMEGRRMVLSVVRDITARQQAERALREATRSAEAANLAKSEFLANMSHEIRTPMNAILGLTHLLGRTTLAERQRDFVDKIGAAGRSLLSLLNDILDFSRIEAGRLELEVTDFRLSEVLDSLGTMMSVTAGTKDIELVIRADSAIPDSLRGDPLRLKQILINLTGNAVKFTERGEVVVGVAPVRSDDNGVTLRFSVRDSGIGIPRDLQERLFGAFSQADTSTTRRFGGSGLGLAICKSLVDLLGGEIGVDSTPGVGSEFWFTVTLGRGEAVAPLSVTDLDVLIADDHDVARETLKLTAESLGWVSDVVASGTEALDHTRSRLDEGHPYDVLILDWKMPDLDGLAVGKAIRTECAPGVMPIVIMVTAYAREDVVNAPEAVNIDAVLVKPVTASSLFNAVMEARGRRGAGTAALAGPAGEGDRLKEVRLLVVEDNAINQTVARHILEAEGAQVAIAGDGRRAVDLLAADPGGFDAVLMDIQMPVMDGYQATQTIRRELGLIHLPLIALTAGAFQSERERALTAGMDDFISKPFDVNRMVDAVRRQIGQAADRRGHPDLLPPAPAIAVAVADPGLPGVNRDQALRRCGNDEALLDTLFGMFLDQYGDAIERLRQECGDELYGAAIARSHSLRGVADNLGASTVAAAALTLERALKQKRIADLPDALDRLDTTLTPLLAALAARPGPAMDAG